MGLLRPIPCTGAVDWALGAFREFFDSVKLKAIPRIAGGGNIRVRVAGQGVGSFGHLASAAIVPNELSPPLCSRLFPVGRYPKRARKCRSRIQVSAASYARSLFRTGKARQRAASIPNSTSRGAQLPPGQQCDYSTWTEDHRLLPL